MEAKQSNSKPDSINPTPSPAKSCNDNNLKVGDNENGLHTPERFTQHAIEVPGSPTKKVCDKNKQTNGNIKPSLSRSSSKSATAKTSEIPVPTEKKKLPMNKVLVGTAPGPNLKGVKSKIGSLANATYKPSGGNKKITHTKIEWHAKSKIDSLKNTAYKPGGGDKKIETVKLDFKEKAKPKVASTANITHKPGGGVVKISTAAHSSSPNSFEQND